MLGFGLNISLGTSYGMKNNSHKNQNPDETALLLEMKPTTSCLSRQTTVVILSIMKCLSGEDLNSALTINKDFNKIFNLLPPQYRIMHLEWQHEVFENYFEKRRDGIKNAISELKQQKEEHFAARGKLCIDRGWHTGESCCIAGLAVSLCTGFFQCLPSLCSTMPLYPNGCCLTSTLSSQLAVNCGANCYPLATPCLVGYGLMGSAVTSVSSFISCGMLSTAIYSCQKGRQIRQQIELYNEKLENLRQYSDYLLSKISVFKNPPDINSTLVSQQPQNENTYSLVKLKHK
jgi:hypothetical protein